MIRERKRPKGGAKKYDLRPLVTALAVDGDWSGEAALTMTLLLMSGKSGRPDEVLAALALDCLAARVQRTMITLREVDYGT
jgi:hypothetical protein